MTTLTVASGIRDFQLSPRTPRTARYPPPSADTDEGRLEAGLPEERQAFLHADDDVEEDDDDDLSDSPLFKDPDAKPRLSAKDRHGIILLVVLYLIQGVPIGLALGSVPFLLKEKLSYSQLATFALSGYPFSMKLLWSPIVDSIYLPSVGRRRSWVIPMQLLVGSLMLYISLNVERFLEDPATHIYHLTVVFTLLVFLSATQDIAVDGWALTLLSQDNLSYASTCQTIGLNAGFFSSFTVFLAFNSQAFADKFGVPRLTLDVYLRFWAMVSYSVTLWLVFVKKEDSRSLKESGVSLISVYKTIWSICKLRHIQLIILVHSLGKIGYAANEVATSLKMVDKGFKREDLAIAVLIDFPCQILGGWVAARWARGDKPLRPWIWAFWPRLGFCLVGTLIVYWFPKPPITMDFFVLLVVWTVLSSFTQTVQFVGMSAFHTRVSDPLIGGTYMTLMNTFTHLGNIWPKWFVLKGVDLFSVANCQAPQHIDPTLLTTSSCVSDYGKGICSAVGGECVYERDGYYIVSGICMIIGIVLYITWIIPTAKKAQALPISAWRVKL